MTKCNIMIKNIHLWFSLRKFVQDVDCKSTNTISAQKKTQKGKCGKTGVSISGPALVVVLLQFFL